MDTVKHSPGDIELPMAPEDMSMRALLGEDKSVYSMIFESLIKSCSDRLDFKNVDRVADRFFVHWLNANPWCISQIVVEARLFPHKNIIVNQSYKKITTRNQTFEVPREDTLEGIIKDLKKRENL